MASESHIEKGHPETELVAERWLLADSIENAEHFEMQIARVQIDVPVRATFTIDHERSDDGEENEFKIKWARD